MAVLVSGCISDPDSRPEVDLSLVLSSQHNRRGMIENERGVIQGQAKTRIPLRFGGSFRFTAWGNLDLTDDPGDAWRPAGHGGELTQVDLTAAYGRTLGPVDLSGGVTSYVLPNGSEFLNGPRGTTSEIFMTAGSELFEGELYGLYPLVSAHYDIDEVGGLYLQGAVFKGVPITEALRLVLSVSLGYSDTNHSSWTYGVKEAGLSDLRGTISLEYRVAENTTVALGVSASTILDNDIEAWIESRAIVRRTSPVDVERGIETDTVWYTLGLHSRF